MKSQLRLDLERKYQEIYGSHIDEAFFLSWIDKEARALPEFKERIQMATLDHHAAIATKTAKKLKGEHTNA